MITLVKEFGDNICCSIYVPVAVFIQTPRTQVQQLQEVKMLLKSVAGLAAGHQQNVCVELVQLGNIHDSSSHRANRGFVTLLNSKHMNLPPGLSTRRASCRA